MNEIKGAFLAVSHDNGLTALAPCTLIPSAIFPKKMCFTDRTGDLAFAMTECHYGVSGA